ncbi:hypothetical protein AGMMS49957_08970 [Synergistales bacterium]|nr:hypothetical protein AGMMS49957_08970 [Synergistales bacterium]
MKRLFVVLLVAVLALGFSGAAFAYETADVKGPNGAFEKEIKDNLTRPASSKISISGVAAEDIIKATLDAFGKPGTGKVIRLAKVTVSELPSGHSSLPYAFAAGHKVYDTGTKGFADSKDLTAITGIVNNGTQDIDPSATVIAFYDAKVGNKDSGSGGGCSVLTLGALLAFAIPLVAVSAKRKSK